MTCPHVVTNCGPCELCGKQAPPQPVLPRCQDVVFPDGVWTNPTLVTQGGCIVEIQQGTAPLYTPDPCCNPVGTRGGGGTGLPGEQGEPGEAATITIGLVTTGAPGSNATVTNSGTSTNAVLNFTIPRGAPGESGDTQTGVTGSFAGLELKNGAVQALPIDWPPIMQVSPSGKPTPGIKVTATKDANGTLTLEVDATQLAANFQALIDDLQAQLDAKQTQIDALTKRVDALCAGQPCP